MMRIFSFYEQEWKHKSHDNEGSNKNMMKKIKLKKLIRKIILFDLWLLGLTSIQVKQQCSTSFPPKCSSVGWG